MSYSPRFEAIYVSACFQDGFPGLGLCLTDARTAAASERQVGDLDGLENMISLNHFF